MLQNRQLPQNPQQPVPHWRNQSAMKSWAGQDLHMQSVAAAQASVTIPVLIQGGRAPAAQLSPGATDTWHSINSPCLALSPELLQQLVLSLPRSPPGDSRMYCLPQGTCCSTNYSKIRGMKENTWGSRAMVCVQAQEGWQSWEHPGDPKGHSCTLPTSPCLLTSAQPLGPVVWWLVLESPVLKGFLNKTTGGEQLSLSYTKFPPWGTCKATLECIGIFKCFSICFCMCYLGI